MRVDRFAFEAASIFLSSMMTRNLLQSKIRAQLEYKTTFLWLWDMVVSNV